MKIIKTISLWQPWAWAVAANLKEYETRGERFIHYSGIREHRGPIAIHAAQKRFNPWDYTNEFAKQLLKDGLRSIESLVYGAVVCIADVEHVCSTESIRERMSPREKMYGDWSDGRYCIHLINVRPLRVPEPLCGHQGLFNWELPLRFDPITLLEAA